ncbi:MAG: Asp-tRNA(Asn)/Glu-tRNA(Gln) amidotransferase subunit GatC [Candidatus Wolfebacteria bacterium]|nr:Asp-tRNA(Asn)/Glu-tRNA(Gln) amidotransferase subunit GatC [Candidatus Wolfebacteria bacterium]
MGELNKKTLEYLAGLGKLDIKKGTEEKLLHDLGEILSRFEELKEVDTENVESMAGGVTGINVFRDDESVKINNRGKTKARITDAFPEKQDGLLKVPAIFE